MRWIVRLKLLSFTCGVNWSIFNELSEQFSRKLTEKYVNFLKVRLDSFIPSFLTSEKFCRRWKNLDGTYPKKTLKSAQYNTPSHCCANQLGKIFWNCHFLSLVYRSWLVLIWRIQSKIVFRSQKNKIGGLVKQLILYYVRKMSMMYFTGS